MTDWDTCRCRKSHATARGFARCKVRGLSWITGRGDWALVAWCGGPTITLWPTEAQAGDRASILYSTRCGQACRGAHQIVHIQRKAAPHGL